MKRNLVIWSIFGVMTMIGTSTFAHTNEPSRYNVLKEKFDHANAPVTAKSLHGAFLGRCFTDDSNTPDGMVLTTIEDTSGGPEFTSFRTEMVEKNRRDDSNGKWVELPAQANDSTTSASLEAFWQNPSAEFRGLQIPLQVQNLEIKNGIADSQSKGTLMVDENSNLAITSDFSIKRSTDGYFYVHSTYEITVKVNNLPASESIDNYCYFFKRLF